MHDLQFFSPFPSKITPLEKKKKKKGEEEARTARDCTERWLRVIYCLSGTTSLVGLSLKARIRNTPLITTTHLSSPLNKLSLTPRGKKKNCTASSGRRQILTYTKIPSARDLTFLLYHMKVSPPHSFLFPFSSPPRPHPFTPLRHSAQQRFINASFSLRCYSQ